MKKYIKHIVASADKYPALFTFDNFKPSALQLSLHFLIKISS